MYIRRTPKTNYGWYNDPKLSQEDLENRRDKQPPFPDGHFIV